MKKKSSLSNTETQAYSANAKRLRAVGVIPPEEKPLTGAQWLTVEQTGGPTESFVHTPPVGGYGIAVWVRIVALKSGINVCECQITPGRWDDTGIWLVEMPEGDSDYRVHGGVEYAKDAVLNHRIASKRPLTRGQILEGVVIAMSFASLPGWCHSGISVGAELCFFDQFDNTYPLKVDLRVMRDLKRGERTRHSTGLFGPAVNASTHGTRGRDGTLPKAPSVSRPNGRRYINSNASPDVGFKYIS
ncbi:MAG TPA: hypothetical protein VNZ03_02110 [Terriglobales bacterium]|jgi:hypothetical protein|nr:hypothetical protein [Terriglobales bacterium]